MPISLWAKTQSFLFPTRSSLVKEPEAVASAAAFPSAAKRELTPPGPACQQLFFRTPKFFFGARREDFSPAQKRELIPTPSRCQPLSSAFFKKLVRPAVPASRPLGLPGSARHSVPQRRERVMHLHAASVNDFLFFSDFFLHPRQRPFGVWCLIRGYHMLSLITCRQLPSGVFTVIALWKRPRPRSARQRRVPEQT